jgi:hypothetical protein
MTALDIAPVIQGVMLTDLEAADEVRCEVRHYDVSRCTVVVMWSRPAYPCGCSPRMLVCQATYEWVFHNDGSMSCGECDQGFPTSEWRKGWYPV